MEPTPTRRRLAAFLLLLGASGCLPAPDPVAVAPAPPRSTATAEDAPLAPGGMPARPLALPTPPEPSPDYHGRDLAKADGDELADMAGRLAEEGDPREAARLQHWAVKLGAGGQYNLACWTARAGDVEGAFHWLQEAALDEGVDSSWAVQDPDLASFRKDPRWASVEPFLRRCNAYWAASGHRHSVLVVPQGYDPKTPIAVLVGMHGLGHRPDGFVDPEAFQGFADELKVAIVGVSGTFSTGRRSFVWSEDPAADARQVRRALDDLADRLTVKKGHLIAFGFSQGAQMGFEVAWQDPDDYKGAIVMSPGTTRRFFRLQKLRTSPGNKAQGYVCLCGAGEHPGNVQFTRDDAEFARKAGARVELKLYEGMDRHTLPPDFADAFVHAVRFIEGEVPGAKLE